MRIEALIHALTFYNMRDVFQVIPKSTVELLEAQLANLFMHQEELERAIEKLKLESQKR